MPGTGQTHVTNERDEFVARYGGIYEHSAWVAERSYESAAGNADVHQLAEIFAACVDNAPKADKLRLIRAHPDLAGTAAVRGELAAASTEEQASAGLDQCSSQEFEQFQLLNEQYANKFGFPFVMAVRDSARQEILAAFSNRCDNDYETEFATAIAEIHKIAKLRLAALDTS
jgi:OHCU decarboxylase